MDIQNAIRGRRSIRSYRDTPVEKEKLLQVLEAGRLAPSAKNRQEWKFIAVTDPAAKLRLVEAGYGKKFLAEAPVVIVACATEVEYVMACGQPAGTVDVSIALSFMLLQAHELGLGTCWLGNFSEAAVKEILDIPAAVRVVAMTPLGYPADDPAARPRKSLEQVVSFEKYSE
jgi:nitroreductase